VHAGQRLHAVDDRRHLVALELERPREGLTDGAVVVGDEDVWRHPSIVRHRDGRSAHPSPGEH
jgi:hypothetical protein